MSWKASGFIKECRLRSPIRKAVMLVVADFASENAKALGIEIPEGWSACWAGTQSISEAAEVDEKTVRRVFADMEEVGLIRRSRRTDPRTGYRLDDAVWIETNRQPLRLPANWESSREVAEREARERRRNDVRTPTGLRVH